MADPKRVTIRSAGKPGDWGWIIMAHGEIYNKQFDWDSSIEISTAEIIAQFAKSHDQSREACWIAELNGERVGCIMCVPFEESKDTAKLRLLVVQPSGRGFGVGSKLVGECLRFAKEAGYIKIVLWTLDVLKSARKMYQGAGFEPMETKPTHAFGKDMIAETWSRTL